MNFYIQYIQKDIEQISTFTFLITILSNLVV